MNIYQMRDEYEQALAAFAKLPHGQAQFKSYRSDDQHYANAPGDGVARGELEIGWWAWQASRASLVVVLPDTVTLLDPNVCEVVDAVEATGVKVAT